MQLGDDLFSYSAPLCKEEVSNNESRTKEFFIFLTMALTAKFCVSYASSSPQLAKD